MLGEGVSEILNKLDHEGNVNKKIDSLKRNVSE
jgi:hypothetical protein